MHDRTDEARPTVPIAPADPITDWLDRRAVARAAGVRLALILAGPEEFAAPRLDRLAHALDGEVVRLRGEHPARSAQYLFGRTVDALIIDAAAGLDLDLVGLAAGTLRGGGVFVLRLPEGFFCPGVPDRRLADFAAWPWDADDFGDRFPQHLRRTGERHPGIGWLTPTAYRPPQLPEPAPRPAIGDDLTDCRTADQARAVAAILDLARDERTPATLVLRSGRGRGKSAALGIAAARLSRKWQGSLLLTAAREGAMAAALERFQALGGNPRRLRTLPPDAALKRRSGADLLLVDEAAALPPEQLRELLRRHPRAVLASTAEGYEGTGRGLDLSFAHVLDDDRPGWQRSLLREPIRWTAADPLEAFLRDLLMPEPEERAAPANVNRSAVPQPVDRGELAADPALLAAVVGLLTTAHYRTRPNDLRIWLDAPGVEIWAMRGDSGIAAVAVTVAEGGVPAALTVQVVEGRRRLRGHQLAQSLAAHAHTGTALGLRGRRIARIAVTASARRQGIGSRLVAAIAAAAEREGCAWIGSSYGATPALLGFWWQAGLQTVRLGLRPDRVTGRHAALALRGLSPTGERLITGLRRRLARDLPVQRQDPDFWVPAEILTMVEADLPAPSPVSNADDHALLTAFVERRCDYLVAQPALFRVVRARCAPLPDMLRQRVLEGARWDDLCRHHAFAGRRQAIAALRAAAAVLVREL